MTDVTGLAHANHHDTPFAGENQLAGTHEITVYALQQVLNGFEFQANSALRGLNQIGGLAHDFSAAGGLKAADYNGKGASAQCFQFQVGSWRSATLFHGDKINLGR